MTKKRTLDVERLSLRKAAAEAGISHSTVSRLANELGLGLVVDGRRTGLTRDDIATLKANARSGPGNPNMVAGSEHQATAAAAGGKARWKKSRAKKR